MHCALSKARHERLSESVPPPSSEEFARGRWDVARWALVYLGVRLHPGQRRMAQAYLQRTKSRWRALYLWIMVAAGNRAGKTLGLAIIILHSCVYRMGLEPPVSLSPDDVLRWGKLPFHHWHFAVEQGPAEQVFSEISLLLQGIHPAQRAGCPWADQVGGFEKLAFLSDLNGPKERGEYAWIKLNPELGGAEIHFRSTKQKALGSLGQNMHGLSFDEAGLETNLTYLVKEVFHARRLGTGGQFILISTPSAATSTDFEDLWYSGDPDDPFHERRRFSMRMSSRDNVGYGLDRTSFESLIEGMDEGWIAQNIDGEFIQATTAWFNANSVRAAFKPDLPEDDAPQERRIYLHSLDPGLKDKCWSLVFEVLSDGKARGVHIDRQLGKQTTRGIVAMGVRSHLAYEAGGKSLVETGVDTTALGGHMFRDLLEEHIAIRSVEFGGQVQVKRKMLSDLRSALDEGRLAMPASGYWAEVRKQLLAYKLADRKTEQDLVMGLAIIVKLLRSAPMSFDQRPAEFDYNQTTEQSAVVDDGINARTVRAAMAARFRAVQSLTELRDQ